MRNGVCGAVLLSVVCGLGGCKSSLPDTGQFKKAIDFYYAGHPSCLWEQPRQFPVQVEAGDKNKTQPYDALADQGLLTRKGTDKKELLGLVNKQMETYDLSEMGKAQMTYDTAQPGFGNFCYGHPVVKSIDSTNVDTSKQPQTAVVAFHYTFNGVPPWAGAPEVQNTYPAAHDAAAGPVAGTVQLVNGSTGWSVVPPGQMVE